MQRSAAVVGVLAVLGVVFGLVGAGVVLLVAGFVLGAVHALAGVILLIGRHNHFTSLFFCSGKAVTLLLCQAFGAIYFSLFFLGLGASKRFKTAQKLPLFARLFTQFS